MTSNRRSSMTKVFFAAALTAGLTGVASADDSSNSRLGGDSYSYFNTQPLDKSISAWRQSNPNGQPLSWYQSSSGVGAVWKPAPVLVQAPSDPAFKQTHPAGLTVAELQGLSSPGPAWHSTPVKARSTAAIENGKETSGGRMAAFFRAGG